jgi:hypothetical protein
VSEVHCSLLDGACSGATRPGRYGFRRSRPRWLRTERVRRLGPHRGTRRTPVRAAASPSRTSHQVGDQVGDLVGPSGRSVGLSVVARRTSPASAEPRRSRLPPISMPAPPLAWGPSGLTAARGPLIGLVGRPRQLPCRGTRDGARTAPRLSTLTARRPDGAVGAQIPVPHTRPRLGPALIQGHGRRTPHHETATAAGRRGHRNPQCLDARWDVADLRQAGRPTDCRLPTQAPFRSRCTRWYTSAEGRSRWSRCADGRAVDGRCGTWPVTVAGSGRGAS